MRSIKTARTMLSRYVIFLITLCCIGGVGIWQATAGISEDNVILRGAPSGQAQLPALSANALAGTTETPQVTRGFYGVSDLEGVTPPNTSIAVGPGLGRAGRVVEVTKAGVQIWDKSGIALTPVYSLSLFLNNADDPFDPKIIFDSASQRFFIVACSGASTTSSLLYIAISNDSTPDDLTSEWTVLSGSALTQFDKTPTWMEYPSIGSDNNAIYVTGNLLRSGGTQAGCKIRVFNKNALLRGVYSTSFKDFDINGTETQASYIQPAHVSGSTDNGHFYLINYDTANTYRLWEIAGAPQNPTIVQNQVYPWSTGTLTTIGAPQLGTYAEIETFSGHIMNAVYRNGHIWMAMTTDSYMYDWTDIYWAKIATNGGTTASSTGNITTPPTIADEGRISDYGSALMPAINVNSRGDAMICYTLTSEMQYPDMRYVFRAADDPAGMFREAVRVADSAGYYSTSDGSPLPWGRCASVVVDPSDDSFWLAHELVTVSDIYNSTWGTYIAHTAARASGKADLLVRNQYAANYIGDNIIDRTASGEKTSQLVEQEGTAVYEVQLQNDGLMPDPIVILGTTGTTDWDVKYFDALDGGTDITAEITSTGWQPIYPLEPGESLDIRVEVTPGVKTTAGSGYEVMLYAGTGDPTMGDAVRLITVLPGGKIIRASVSSDNSEGDRMSHQPAMSADGRYVAFVSAATNLVADDTNNAEDVFVYDILKHTTERVSVTSSEGQANSWSEAPSISADGRYIAFRSAASNLVTGDTNGKTDLFIRDMLAGTTVRITKGLNGQQPNNDSTHPVITPDGKNVVYVSYASNLVAGDVKGYRDVFLYNTTTQATERISIASNGVEANQACDAPAVSADGRYVVFRSGANNLVAGDTNNALDIFLRDRVTGTTTRISVDKDGKQANGISGYECDPVISADGRYIAFRSAASNLVRADYNAAQDIFLYDRETGTPTIISMGVSGYSGAPTGTNADSGYRGLSMSSDARYIAFTSSATNFFMSEVERDRNSCQDVFIYDRAQNTIARVSKSYDDTEADGESGTDINGIALSGNGRYIAFDSLATNLVAGDVNDLRDIFIRDWNSDGARDFQSDLLLRSVNDIDYVGGDIYGSIEEQTKQQEIGTSQTAIYPIRLENDGAFFDTFRLTADKPTTGWTVNYYDALVGGTNITARVTGTGWLTQKLKPGETIELRAEVSGEKTVTEMLDVNITATSENQSTIFDTIRIQSVKTPLSAVALSVSHSSPQPVNTPLTLKAAAQGGVDVAYQFTVERLIGGVWTRIAQSGLGPIDSYTWIPAVSGHYRFSVLAHDNGASSADVTDITLDDFVIAPKISAATLTISPVSPQPLGAVLTLTAKATGGADIRYRFKVGETIIRDYDAAPTCQWNPTETGVYTLKVDAKEADSVSESDTVSSQKTFTVASPLSAVTVTTNADALSAANKPVIITASAVGGANIEYNFRIGYMENGTWNWPITRGYQASNSITWTPNTARDYTIVAYAREVGNKTAYQCYTTCKHRVVLELSEVELTLGADSPRAVYSPIGLMATPIGGANVEYNFKAGYQVDGNWVWTNIQQYSTKNTCVWVPDGIHKYSLVVYAREGRSITPIRSAVKTIDIKPAMTGVSLAPSLASPKPVNTSITLRATPTGGGTVEYWFRVGYVVDGQWIWTTIRDYATTPTCIWKPTEARSYVVQVFARELESIRRYDAYTTLSYSITAR